ncbi:MAG TPA: tetratricopeptide repeat protein, partial [Chloroflexota bacterium]|nr:tetratricopeptide repeat protein [Chloroflexota bacterium]
KILRAWLVQTVDQFIARRRADALVRFTLHSLLDNRPTSGQALVLDRQRQTTPEHFGLAYVAGLYAECLASAQTWDDRAPSVENAAQSYADAMQLAKRNLIDGASTLPDLYDSRWADGLSLAERALAAASYQLGRLRTVEFRVRDPRVGAACLHLAIERSKGYHPARYYLGEAYLLDGRFDEAERVWRDALALIPGEPTLLTVLANLPVDRVHHAVKTENWLDVLQELARLSDGEMPESERRTIEGDAYAALGHTDRARASWEAALRADRLAVGVGRRLRSLARCENGGVL